MNKPCFYITTAIAYANGSPHLGHAYEAISCDVFARYKRLEGYDVHFLTGMDEHGQKVEKTAKAKQMQPQDFVDNIAEEFKNMMALLNISNDDFIRTSEERHKQSVKGIWQKLKENDDIYLGAYHGWYSVRDEAFFGEDELTKGPNDTKLAPSGAPVEWVEEPSYFFKLSNYGDRLLQYYEDNPNFIQPDFRKNEIVNFVKQGLIDLSISRTSFKWGIDVPDDEAHIMYVWLDALTNYISALGYPNEDDPRFKKYWPVDMHVIGKDILRFHAIYWPAFLMSAGLALPKQIFGHGFLNIAGEKMSKSLGNVLTPKDMVAEFGLEPLRYFLMREVPYGQDGSFSRESIIQRINSDLANDFGNLAMRVLSMIHKNCGGLKPKMQDHLDDVDQAILTLAKETQNEIRTLMEQRQVHRALEAIWRIIAEANRYIDFKAPWSLRKTDFAAMEHVLALLCEVLRIIGIYSQMIVPNAATKLLDQLAIPENQRSNADILNYKINAGVALPAPEGLFPRFVEIELEAK